MIQVAGLGTRGLPASEAIPKELLLVRDRSYIGRALKSIAVGISVSMPVIKSGKEVIENHYE